MYSKLDVKLLEIAGNTAKKYPVIKKILKPIYYPYKNWRKRKRNQEFQKNSLVALKDFTDCLTKNGYSYTLIWGTLLGAVRNKGFIPHDYDIDVAVWYKDYDTDLIKHLKKIGFDLVHEFTVDGGKSGMEHTFLRDGVSIDIFYLYEPVDKLPYCCGFSVKPGSFSFRESQDKYGGVIPVRYEAPHTYNRIITQFENLELYIPDNSHELLEVEYGPNYMIPDPDWHEPTENPYRIVWKSKNAQYHE